MDTTARSIAKATTWQVLGFLVMMGLTYALTGSLVTGSAVALGGAITGALTYVAHERAWARVRWGRAPHPEG